MMIPDAPWIRDAERYGVPEAPAPVCPVCGEEAETLYVDIDGDVLGCDCCLKAVDAYDYREHASA